MTISPAVKLRSSFRVPVEQKVQLSVHPACELTQRVPTWSSAARDGMYTVSTGLNGGNQMWRIVTLRGGSKGRREREEKVHDGGKDGKKQIHHH